MRAWFAVVAVVAIGLIWSVAAVSKWVPVNSAGLSAALQSRH